MSPTRRIVTLVLAACAFASLASAQDSLEAAKRKELEDVQRRVQENRDAASRLKGKENAAVTQLRRTEKDLNVTRKRLAALQRRQKQLDQQLDVTRADLQRSVQSLDQQKERLAHRLRSIYKAGGDRDLEFMLSAQSFGQLLERWDFLVMIAEQDRVMLDDLRGRKEEVEANQQRLQLHLTEVDRNAKKTTKESSRLSDLRAQRAGTVQTIQSQRQAYEAAAAELEKTARAIRGLLATLEKKRREEADRAKAQGREPQPYAGDFARGQGQLAWPVRGSVIGHFGNEVHPKWGTITPNNGIDITCDIGTPVHVVAKGRVDYTSEDYGTYGQMILVNHGDGFYTMYGHLSSIGVTVGQEVQAGAVIGQSGDSGSLKGPILHFEIRKGGTPLDPQDWLQ